MNLRLLGTLKLSNGSEYFSLLAMKVDVARNVTLDPSNLVNWEREDLMDVSLKMSLTNGTKAWSTDLALDFFEQSAAQIKMPIGKYIDLTIKALTNEIDGKYIYEIVEETKNSAQFSWKEKMTNDEITIKLGTCNLQSENITKTTTLMLSYSTERVCELEKQMRASEAELKSIKDVREQAVRKLEKFVHEKEVLEKDLYVKFVAVLNEKKRKIRELNEKLQGKNEDLESTAQPLEKDTSSTSKSPTAKKNRKVKVVAGTSIGKPKSDSGSDTDVEMPSKTSKVARKNVASDDLLLDDSQNDSFTFEPRKKIKKS